MHKKLKRILYYVNTSPDNPPLVEKCVIIDKEFEMILIGAIKYAINSNNYDSYEIVQYIISLLEHLTDETINMFIKNILETKYFDNENIWVNFIEECKKELNKRRVE